jgi:hypothetical protein
LLVAEWDWYPDKALVADCANLGRISVRHGVNERSNTGLDEIDEFNWLVGLIERTFMLQVA